MIKDSASGPSLGFSFKNKNLIFYNFFLPKLKTLNSFVQGIFKNINFGRFIPKVLKFFWNLTKIR